MNFVRRLGWTNLAVFGAAVVVGVVGIVGAPDWITGEQLIAGLLTLTVALICLVYFRLTVILDDKLAGLSARPLEAILKPRREWLESGGILSSFDSIKKPGVDILVVGVSCINFLSENEADLREAVIQGAKFQFVLVDPDVSFLGLYDVNMPNQSREADLRADIYRSLDRIARLDAVGSVKCRLYGGVPMFSALWVRERAREFVFVEFYTYGGAPANRPGFFASREISSKWYQFFARSLTSLWDSSRQTLPADVRADEGDVYGG